MLPIICIVLVLRLGHAISVHFNLQHGVYTPLMPLVWLHHCAVLISCGLLVMWLVFQSLNHSRHCLRNTVDKCVEWFGTVSTVVQYDKFVHFRCFARTELLLCFAESPKWLHHSHVSHFVCIWPTNRNWRWWRCLPYPAYCPVPARPSLPRSGPLKYSRKVWGVL